MKILILATCLMAGTEGMSQISLLPGYVVLNNGDTIKGFIESRSSSSDRYRCYFRKERRGQSVRYDVSEIKAFGLVNHKYLEAVEVKDANNNPRTEFARLILRGRASLFSYHGQLWVRHDSLGVYSLIYAGKTDVKGRNRVKGLLNFIVSDCRTQKLLDDEVTIADTKIESLLDQYNHCKRSPSIHVTSSKVPMIQLQAGVMSGVYSFDPQINDISGRVGTDVLRYLRLDGSSSSILGLSLGIAFPRLSRNLIITAEYGKFNLNLHGFASGQGSSYSYSPLETEEITISSAYSNLNIGFKVLFPTRVITPFLRAGLSNFTSSGFSGVRTHLFYVNDVVVNETTSPWRNGNFSGTYFGVGLQRAILGRLAITAEARVCPSQGFDDNKDAFPMGGSFNSFLVGIVF